MGKGLRDFTVPPAPAGSLDAPLAATGMPILAIDLRRTPPRGAVAEWLNAPHQTRSTGAAFSDANTASFLMGQKILASVIALLFVEKTTAARKNSPLAGK